MVAYLSLCAITIADILAPQCPLSVYSGIYGSTKLSQPLERVLNWLRRTTLSKQRLGKSLVARNSLCGILGARIEQPIIEGLKFVFQLWHFNLSSRSITSEVFMSAIPSFCRLARTTQFGQVFRRNNHLIPDFHAA